MRRTGQCNCDNKAANGVAHGVLSVVAANSAADNRALGAAEIRVQRSPAPRTPATTSCCSTKDSRRVQPGKAPQGPRSGHILMRQSFVVESAATARNGDQHEFHQITGITR
jgi:hypothetical protein